MENEERRSPPDVTARPARVRSIQEYRLGDELLVYLPNAAVALVLNRPAVAIWELCDGRRTAEDIGQELGRWLGRPGEELLADVREGLAQLGGLGLLEAR